LAVAAGMSAMPWKDFALGAPRETGPEGIGPEGAGPAATLTPGIGEAEPGFGRLVSSYARAASGSISNSMSSSCTLGSPSLKPSNFPSCSP
jgi:hypothetical protein